MQNTFLKIISEGLPMALGVGWQRNFRVVFAAVSAEGKAAGAG